MKFKPHFFLLVLVVLNGLGYCAKAQIKEEDSTDLSFIIDSTKLTESIKPQEVISDRVITGLVIDKQTREPIPFATVFIPNTPIGTTTEYGGIFRLDVSKRTNDTLKIKLIGYKTYTLLLQADSALHLIEMELDKNTLDEVVVRAGEDPAITLIKNVIKHKPQNDPARLNNYRYEAYNTVEIDLLNLSKEEFEHLPIPMIKKFSYIYDNLDTSGEKTFLPFYLTETISDYYYQQKPQKVKEYIRASKVKGINNTNFTNSISKYLGNTYIDLLPYNSYIRFFNNSYVSPISGAGLFYYKYRIIDTIRVAGHRVIELIFVPKQYGTNTFIGKIKIVDSSFALQYIEATQPKAANVNWVKNANFFKTYMPLGDSMWFCTKEGFTAELYLAKEDGLFKMPGIIARKKNSYKHIKVNDDSVSYMLNKLKLDVTVNEKAQVADDTYWQGMRHDSLNKNEKAIYSAIDRIEADPKYRTFKNFARIVLTGSVRVGPVEFGPYWSMYSNNLVEGNRFRFSMGTTPKLFKKLYLSGYVAYGTQDQRFKYNGMALYIPQKYPRTFFRFTYTHDIDRTVNYYDRVSFDNILNVAIRKNGIPQKFMFATDVRLEAFKEYGNGFSTQLNLIHKIFDPYDPLPDAVIFKDEQGAPSTTVTTSEIGITLRYAPRERFVEGNYFRFSLGSKKPIVQLRYAMGIKGIFNSGYNYHRINFSVSDRVEIAPFGSLYVNVFGGKYFGDLPYTLLEQHPGNESYYYNKYAFNMMNQYEFLSDQFVGANLEHSIGGGVFKYIPLVKKLNLRQFWTAKGVVGSLTDANAAINLNKGFMFRTLSNDPYVEVGTGIENIFRLFRVDFIWRVTPSSLPNEVLQRNFGVLGSMKVTF
ncbi:MAG: DUF5686 family protein [Flavipsychrobacter sp.]